MLREPFLSSLLLNPFAWRKCWQSLSFISASTFGTNRVAALHIYSCSFEWMALDNTCYLNGLSNSWMFPEKYCRLSKCWILPEKRQRATFRKLESSSSKLCFHLPALVTQIFLTSVCKHWQSCALVLVVPVEKSNWHLRRAPVTKSQWKSSISGSLWQVAWERQ